MFDMTKTVWMYRPTNRKTEYLGKRARHAFVAPVPVRHNTAIEIRRRAGIETAQVVLGHSSATLTDAVYAERYWERARRAMGEIG